MCGLQLLTAYVELYFQFKFQFHINTLNPQSQSFVGTQLWQNLVTSSPTSLKFPQCII